MAAASGLTGKVMLGGNTVVNVKNWKLSFKMGKADYVPFGAAVNVAKKRLATVLDVSGSFEMVWDGADTNGQTALQTAILAGTSTTLLLYVNGTNYYTGSCIMEMDVETEAEGIPGRTISFEQDGGTAWTQAA